jgi:malonate decarboxylase gamma subunit
MARVTKIAHERLVGLAGSSPTFAPGAENYLRMGAIEAIWDTPAAALLEAALAGQAAAGAAVDGRMRAGLARQGRRLAADTVSAVLAA